MEVKPGYKQTEVGPVPIEWTTSPLREFLSFISYGFTNPMPTSESGIYMVTARDISKGRIQFDTARCTTEQAYRLLLSDKSRPRTGDILLTKDGTLGRLAITDDRVICINQSVAILRPNLRADSGFLKTLLESPVYQRRMIEDAGGSTIKHIYITIVDKMPIAVPPTKAEQEAIAGALSDADALIESLEQLIAKKRQIKQGAMQELLTGKRRLPGFSGAWEAKCLGDVTETDPENLGSNTSPEFHFRYISLEDVDSGTLSDHSEQVFRTAPSRARRRVRQNDVLVSTVRPNLLSHLLFSEGGTDWVCSTGFCVVRAKQEVTHSGFVYFLMFSGPVIRQIEALLTGSNYPAINSRDVRALRIPIPPYPEQMAIAAVLSEMDAEITALTLRLAKARQVKQGMMQELLTGRVRLV